jgi:hypothetical protein
MEILGGDDVGEQPEVLHQPLRGPFGRIERVEKPTPIPS